MGITLDLAELDRLKDDFMSSVTHELRTPLTSIRALAELMADDADMPSPQRQRFLGIIVAETERLSRLVNQVLDMAKIESGHGEWRNGDVERLHFSTVHHRTYRDASARCGRRRRGRGVPRLPADDCAGRR